MGNHTKIKYPMRRLDLQSIIDHQEIVDLMIRYGMALDSHDWPLLKTCFAADAVVDLGTEGGRHEGYPAFERVARFFLEGLTSSQHLVSNFVTEVNGDRACATCYLHAQHYLLGTEGGDKYTVGGTYEDELIRTKEGWKIKYRKLIQTWVDGNRRVLEEVTKSKQL